MVVVRVRSVRGGIGLNHPLSMLLVLVLQAPVHVHLLCGLFVHSDVRSWFTSGPGGGKRFGHAVACQGPGEPVLLSIPGFSLSEPKMACTVRSCHSPMVLPMVGKIHVNWSKETLVWIEL